jgi:HAD superfamily hydrolase (TIGR01509 family)
MIKLIIFDLDGVLLSSKDMHFESLNRALKEISPEYVISYDDHTSNYDGLPTARKLQMLSKKGLPENLHKIIKQRKQDYTIEYLEQTIHQDDKLIEIFRHLKKNGFKIHVASNAVRYTIELILFRKGIMRYVDFIISNEDVINGKPHPEMYIKCMLRENVGPRETLIVEDSYVGRQGVFNSGGNLCAVNSPEDLTLDRILSSIRIVGETIRHPWRDEKMNILIPMAGAGSRFAKAGYTFPKPLIEVRGKSMIQVVIENLNIDAHYVYVVQKAHYEKYNLKYVLGMITPGCDIVQVDGVTEGAACTTLLAKEFINTNEQLLIANSDQWIKWDSSDFMYSMQGDKIDGGILTFYSTHPKWSYALVNELGNITEVQEKKPISEHATVGIYYWKRGSDYVRYAEQMIARNLRVNNEFYTCPVFNEAIQDGKLIKNYRVERMMGLGTPEDLNLFLSENP